MLMMQPVPDPKEGHTLGNPDCCCGLCEPGPKRKLIASFTANGKPHHMFRDSKTGYCPWALNCTCKLCADDRINAWKGSMDHNGSKPGKKKSSQSEFYKRYINVDPSISPLGEDNDITSRPKSINFSKTFVPPTPKKVIMPCYKQFRKWVQKNPFPETTQIPEPNSVWYIHTPKIPSKLQIDESGKTTKIDAVEATLNWQTENAIAQSRALKKLDSKVSYMDSKVSTVEEKLDDNFKMSSLPPDETFIKFPAVHEQEKPSLHELHMQIKKKIKKKKRKKLKKKLKQGKFRRKNLPSMNPNNWERDS
ncbi:hypothetical protein PVK06_049080 [Gossypium arboreum]|uniref:Uncharacterized protein n=1 Tax=Gossypium arboreum TaxID=29729 RepID=A0ABR0MHM3_GOSAR|nr:hypothetical protein PVK06_049080 [Gossypium arboreum]